MITARTRAVASRAALLATIFIVAGLAAGSAARADEYARVNLLEENDSLYFKTDKHYTQGIRFSYLTPTLAADGMWAGLFHALPADTPFFNAGDSSDRRAAVLFGQSVFTPDNLRARPPSPHDRPYAGWLYGGASLLQRSGADMLENLEFDIGVVGPAALGKQVQNDWHQLIGIRQANGWTNQLQNEPGVLLSYERLWRIAVPGVAIGPIGIDVVPQIGATLGNVFTYGEVGAMLRIGTNLGADFGPARVRPALSGTDYFDGDKADDGLGGYFYIGTQGRVVAQNIFLDGNTDRTSPSVARKVLVGDVQSGFAFEWSRRVRLDLSVSLRSDEFNGQHSPDEIGTVGLSFAL
ncbi:MAG TPA: lipid A deacylase LpxR family protein [Stellaceae bacterium]|nr:lipid A deacylase LpxR family protein [Stellaceae bacterium]